VEQSLPKLPDYKKPPVVEVAMGVQYMPLEAFSTVQVGLYWETIRDNYNCVEEQPPISHIIEEIEETPGIRPLKIRPNLEVRTKPELPRTWFLNSTGNRLIQVQRDRFLHNWRQTEEKDEYPRYPVVKATFFENWTGFCEFLTDQTLPSPQIDQCELTYVNHIRQGEGWEAIDDIFSLFTFLDWRTRSNFMTIPENLRWSMQFLLPNKMGRLYVEMSIVRIKYDNSLAIRFSLTARGIPSGKIDTESMSGWFDIAREWIVKGFADLTSKKTDSIWGKIT
jgi:uncharacterized protein (TIGR04255 family)